MAEESKKFDPEATVAQPVTALDPEATVTEPMPAVDPETTITGPLLKSEPDPEATDRRPVFDPDATFNPAERASLDPEATVRIPSIARQRKNPFAPKAPAETITANLAALGGLNPLVAMANPILAAVPQIRRTLKHQDAAGLLDGLSTAIGSLEMTAISAGISDDTVGVAVYALCALLDESAAATPWGGDWIENGLLQRLRGESGGAEGFFAQLDQASAEPEKNADLLEFFYVCLALGFEGRYRGSEGGRQALAEVKDRLSGLIMRRRPRPEGLSERWRTPAAQAAADAALATAARANATRAAAEAAARAADAEATMPPRTAPRGFSLARLPRRAIWSAVAGVVGASIVLYMLGLRLLEDQSQRAMSGTPSYRQKADGGAKASASAPVPAPVAGSAAATLAKLLEGLPVTLNDKAGQLSLELQHERQFAAGGAVPAPEVQALLRKIAGALDQLPGAVLVVGHADASPPGKRYATNAELSAARARAAARIMAPALKDSARLKTEAKGESEPIAPNDSEGDRAKNRRVTILLKP
jgi:type VI secretion system protein ImpK